MPKKPAGRLPFAAMAEKYAADVVAGRIIACKWVRLACERHIADRAKEKRADWPYRFDAEKAERPCKFIELLPHTKGKWAAKRESIKLEPWQAFIVSMAFGWVRKADGLRRFREVYAEIPRKNAKSTMSAGVGLFMLSKDGEAGAEVYSGATTEKQAWEVFGPARLMANGRPELKAGLGVEVNASNINIPSTASKFEPLIGKPGDGASPSCAIVDEYHEHQTSDQYDTMLTGMGAREQPLMWIITTAGDNVAGPCYDKRLTVQKILEGVIEDEEKFGLIYGIDEDSDDWTSVEALRKANPNINVSVDEEFLLSRQREAIRNTREQGRFKTKHLNMWVNARNAFFNMQKWANCFGALSLEDLGGEDCYIGLDLASKIDVAALEIVFPRPDGKYIRHGFHYLPEATVTDPRNDHYRGWQAAGDLVVTDGDIIDFPRIRDDIIDLCRRFHVLDVSYDPFQATMLVTELQNENIPVTEFRQTVLTMSEPMKSLDALIIGGKLQHSCAPTHPMTWMMSNVVAKIDAKDNVYPRKDRPELKIDGPVALIMSIGRATMAGDVGISVYSRMAAAQNLGEANA